MTSNCQMPNCKRPVTCLCRHCDKDVCFKHFNEHQIEINNQLMPLTDRLNELQMKVQFHPKMDSFVQLNRWREEQIREIEKKYQEKVRELKSNLSKEEKEISSTISTVGDLIRENDASIDQVKELQQTIERLTKQVDRLVTGFSNDKFDLVGSTVQLEQRQYFVKGKVKCQNIDLYALESSVSLVGYNGLCPQCGQIHVPLAQGRGFYVLSEVLEQKLSAKK